jgi:OOP family OmpA-OmpF porin
MTIRLGDALPLLAALAAAGCGGTITFHGQQAIAVQGSAPAPAKAETPPSRVKVGKGKIEISEKIQFADNKATILEVSFPLLDEIVSVLKQNPQIKKILIEGHASAEGDAGHNLKLSGERAKAVLTYLEQHGIQKERLSSKGFGSTRPIADNKTEEGREKNRRVDFTILEPST